MAVSPLRPCHLSAQLHLGQASSHPLVAFSESERQEKAGPSMLGRAGKCVGLKGGCVGSTKGFPLQGTIRVTKGTGRAFESLQSDAVEDPVLGIRPSWV